jgi:phosphatidylglycerol---prolipoprotein diacylglyceryl transferase
VIPFIHIGPIEIPTFGLMVATAMLVAYYVLRADIARRGIAEKHSATAEMFIVIVALAGIVGAKLYHVLETPSELFAHPAELLLSRYGLAWFGGLIGGFIAWVLVARWMKIPLLESFDAGSVAAALGYGIGRIGCLLSGDGDYGVPTSLPWGMSFPNGLVPTTERVHPTPIYELIVACVIAWVLWRMGAAQMAARSGDPERSYAQLSSRAVFARRATKPKDGSSRFACDVHRRGIFRMRGRAPRQGEDTASGHSASAQTHLATAVRWLLPGSVFAAYLLLTGAARFLVEFIRINPRSFFGLTNAQTASVASMIAGALLWWRAAREKVS